MAPYKTAFVFCVTGDQGQSVASHLLGAGYTVNGLTRNAASATAKRKSIAPSMQRATYADATQSWPRAECALFKET